MQQINELTCSVRNTAAEHSCLTWVHKHQKQLFTELYNGVIDALHEGIDLAFVGKKVVLPASFTSEPCFMQHNLQNTLALWLKFGGSDLFITFTANAGWQEVQEVLLPNQSAHEQLNLITHIFHLKFESLLNDIMKRKIFRHTVSYIYTVEYQKRGLPHTHCIVFLDRFSWLATPEAVDNYISTEIPDKNTQTHLFELVKQFMVHRPCSPGLSLPCMNNCKWCTKNLPKPFLANTEITGDSYMHTQCQDDSCLIQVGNHYVDNQFIISYSLYLTLCYEAHINVECTAGFHAIKYIYKVGLPYFSTHCCTHISHH